MTLCRLRAARTSESKSPSKIPSVHASYVAAPAKGVNTTTARRRRTLSLRLACISSRILDNWGAHQDKVEKIFTYSSPYWPDWAATRSRSPLGRPDGARPRTQHLAVVAHVDVVVDDHHPLRPRRVIGPHRPHRALGESGVVTAQRDGEERRAPACLQEMDVSHRKPQVPGQVLEQGHVAPGPANATRLARRHLAEEGLIDGVDPVGDRGDLDDEARPGRAHVAGVLAERPFRLPHTRRDEALADDLGMCRYLEVVGLAGAPL